MDTSSLLLEYYPTLVGVGSLILLANVVYLVYVREATPLRRIPGPFLASLSKLWIVSKQLQLKRPYVDMELHNKYGPVVRIAPDEVIISSPRAKKIIYGAMSKFTKGDWYCATGDCGWSGNDRLDFLPELNMEKYRIQRRLVGGAYSATHMKEVEPHLDRVMETNISAMARRSGQSVNIDTFFDYFASDCIQAATFGKSRGFVEHDAECGAIAGVHQLWMYMHWIGYFPLLHRVRLCYVNLIEEPIIEPLAKHMSKLQEGRRTPQLGSPTEKRAVFNESIFTWAKKELKAKQEQNPQPMKTTTIADRLLQIQAEKPGLKDGWIKDACVQNFNAGVETIGITLSAMINFLLSHPACQERVENELSAARAAGKLSAMPKLKEIDALPYLSACLSESKRLHPPLAHALPRKVPEEGVELEGYLLPAGTTVGINPWVLGRDKSLYGEDADVFRPERWLEFSEEHLKVLDAHSMFFGTGARSCPGQYLAEAVYTKALPLLLMNLKFVYTSPKQERSIRSTFMTRLDNVMVQWQAKDTAKS